MRELVFVLEQTLGHAAHARNVSRALERRTDSVQATVIPIEQPRRAALPGALPGFRTWTFQASLAARSALTRRLRQGRVDAVFIHTQVAAMLSGSVMRRVPVVVSLDATPLNYDSQGASYGHSRGPGIVEAIKLGWNRSVFRRAPALVSWCQWAADSLTRDYGVPTEKITVIHPGVDVDLFRPAAPGGRSGPVRILFVGGDFERKGGPELLDAMARLGPEVELDIVTGSDVRPAPGVKFRVHGGLQPQSAEIVRLYQEADIFVLPSRGDCFPQAVAEGLASGLPIVATSVGAIPEMIVEGVNGRVVPPRDPRALGLALESLIESASLRREMGIASRKLALAAHDADANNGRIFDLMIAAAESRTAQLQTA